jgi:hypothetical protein
MDGKEETRSRKLLQEQAFGREVAKQTKSETYAIRKKKKGQQYPYIIVNHVCKL